MARKRSKSGGGAGGWVARALVAAVLVTGICAAAYFSRPWWDTDHYKWTVLISEGQQGPTYDLSIKPISSTLGNEDGRLTPALAINCRGHHLNVELRPMRNCDNGCFQDMDIDFTETFVTNDKNGQGEQTQSHWRLRPHSESAQRFNYTDAIGAQPEAAVDAEARKFVARLAAAHEYQVTQGGEARFKTDGLAAVLPKLFAVCPAPAGT